MLSIAHPCEQEKRSRVPRIREGVSRVYAIGFPRASFKDLPSCHRKDEKEMGKACFIASMTSPHITSSDRKKVGTYLSAPLLESVNHAWRGLPQSTSIDCLSLETDIEGRWPLINTWEYLIFVGISPIIPIGRS